MTTLPHSVFDLSHWFVGSARPWKLRNPLAATPVTTERNAASVSVGEGQLHVLLSFKGGSIECIEGCVWLTHDGDCRDVVLEASQTHGVDRDSRLTIFALASSVISVHCS